MISAALACISAMAEVYSRPIEEMADLCDFESQSDVLEEQEITWRCSRRTQCYEKDWTYRGTADHCRWRGHQALHGGRHCLSSKIGSRGHRDYSGCSRDGQNAEASCVGGDWDNTESSCIG